MKSGGGEVFGHSRITKPKLLLTSFTTISKKGVGDTALTLMFEIEDTT